MGKIPELAIIYEDRKLVNYSPLNVIRVGSAMRIGTGKFEDFYSTLIGTYGVSEIAFVDGDEAISGNITPLLKGQDDKYFEDVIFIALGYIPSMDEIEDNYSCENENGRLLTYFNLKDSDKKPKTIGEAIRINYANLVKPEGKLLRKPKDILYHNDTAINLMSGFVIDEEELRKDFYNITCVGDIYQLFIHNQARVYPNVTFDTTKGVILIDDSAVIKPFSYIQGPCYIGKNSIIDGARVIDGTSISEDCSVSGVISNSIVYPNSYIAPNTHIQNSVIGRFCSVGSMTSVENISKSGLYLGDYSELKPGSLVGGGSIIDFGCSIKANNIDFPHYIPPFIKGSETGLSEYPIDELVSETIRKTSVIEEFTDNERSAFEVLFNKTKSLREEFFNE